MGADSFVGWYGVRYPIDVQSGDFDAIVEPFEAETDPRMVAAAAVGLDALWDRDTDGGQYFLLIGTELGELGAEHASEVRVPDAELAEHQARTRALLEQAALPGEPALHLQFRGQY